VKGREFSAMAGGSRPFFFAVPFPALIFEEVCMKVLAEGLYVKHFQYGCGVVTESNEERTSIDFDDHGLKKFVTSIMVVEPAEGTPPKRPGSKRRKKAATAGARATK
jgi:hypothetical protein